MEELADYLRSHSVRHEIKPNHVKAWFGYTERSGPGGYWIVRIRTFKQARLWLGY